MKSLVLCVGILVILTMYPAPLHADTFNCPGGIISIGDHRIDLVKKCGEPDGKESYTEELTDRTDPAFQRRNYVTVDEWTYNFGPGEFMRIVTLKNGTVSGIRLGGYGYSKTSPRYHGDCTEQIVSVGDTRTDVLAKCGEPSWKESRQEEVRERPATGVERKLYVTVDEWTYDLGPNSFVRILTFRNGVLIDIRTGGYGYERKQDTKRK